jgi:hypothetical protein
MKANTYHIIIIFKIIIQQRKINEESFGEYPLPVVSLNADGVA